MDYQDINAQTIDGWIRDGWEWGSRSWAWHREADNAGVQFSHSLEEQIGASWRPGLRC